jgi:amino acid transporter
LPSRRQVFGDAASARRHTAPTEPHLGVALIYVFLAYGGWSDMATLSAELKAGRRGMAVVTIGAVLLLIAIYVALNAAMLHGLGWARLAQSTAPGADVARAAFGAPAPSSSLPSSRSRPSPASIRL